jgi:orotidine-5'-phosphate decarboxylase
MVWAACRKPRAFGELLQVNFLEGVPQAAQFMALARELKDDHGKRIFLDMKLFDIGATVEAAVRGLARFDLDFLTVHGDPHVVRAAREGKAGTDLKILAVTILTSQDRADLDEPDPPRRRGRDRGRTRRAALACRGRRPDRLAAGGRGAPRPARGRGQADRHPRRAPRGSDAGDQKRIATPARAIAAGADHIVVGRPVWAAADPAAQARAILDSLT